MRRFGFIVAGLVMLYIGGDMFFKNVIILDYTQNVSLWWGLIIPFGFFIAGLITLLYGATADNIYRIKSGTVVKQSFTPHHLVPGVTTFSTTVVNNTPITTPIVIPPHWVDDDWALQLEDERGKRGWLHFSENVFDDYPKGARYP